jgi:hypothetical protein
MILFFSHLINNNTGGGFISKRNLSFNKRLAEELGLPFVLIQDSKKEASILRKIFKFLFISSYDGFLKIHEVICKSENQKIFIWIDRSIYGLLAQLIKTIHYKKNIVIITYHHNNEVKYSFSNLKEEFTLNFNLKIILDHFVIFINSWVLKFNSKHNFFISPIDYETSKLKTKYILPPTWKKNMDEEIHDKLELNHIKPFILIVGSYFKPNVHGINWFIENCVPNLKFNVVICGKGVNKIRENVKTFKNLFFFDNVPSLSIYYKSCIISVAPVFFGSGLKIKIAESLINKKHVFSTEFAALGFRSLLGDKNFNENIKICNSSNEFISKINSLQTKGNYQVSSIDNTFDEDYHYEKFCSIFKKYIIKLD